MIEKLYNYLYKITNTINNKIYIGIHSTNDINDGYMGSGHDLKEAYDNYGKEIFIKEVLKYFGNRRKLVVAEVNILTADFIKRDDNYNIRAGGHNGFHTEETRRKQSESAKTRIYTDEGRRKRSMQNKGKNNNYYGKKHSEEVRKKMSIGRLKAFAEGRINNSGKNNPGWRGYYHTPWGIFESSRGACLNKNITGDTLRKYCTNSNIIASKSCKFLIKDEFGKTFKELGFWFEPKQA